MIFKKTLFTGIAAVTLLSASGLVINNSSVSTTVEAKTVSKKLKRNAAIYTIKAKRTHKKTLKKGKTVKIYGYITIKGQRYARIGKGQYIKVNNLASVTSKKSKKTVKRSKSSKHVKSESAALGKKYQSWLNKRNNGNFVAIRNTKMHLTTETDLLDNTPWKIEKGRPIPIWYGKGTVLKKVKGQYYFQYNNIGMYNKFPARIKCSDLTFVEHKDRDKFEAAVNKIASNVDSDRNAMVTLNRNVRGRDDVNCKYSRTLKAGKTYMLNDLWLLEDQKGNWMVTANDYNSELIQAFRSGPKFKDISDHYFIFPYSAISRLAKPDVHLDDGMDVAKGPEQN